MGKKKKKDSKKVRKSYPSDVESRAKEAMKIQPPDENDFKRDNEDNIDKWLRYRPRTFNKFNNIKERSRLRNN